MRRIETGHTRIAVVRTGLILIVTLAVCLAYAPLAPAGTPPVSFSAGGATFDFECMFPYQALSPATGKTGTFMDVTVRNIGGGWGDVKLNARSESPKFAATVKPGIARLAASDQAKCRVEIKCDKGDSSNPVGWIKVTGRRGSESHRIWLKATTLASEPRLELSRGVPLTGQGHLDQELQAYIGKPLTWHFAATNHGGDQDTYKLSYQAGFPCKVKFVDSGGKTITSVSRPGLTRNLLYPKAAELQAVVELLSKLPRNQTEDLTITLGPGNHTTKVSKLKVRLVNPGMLFCVNDSSGLRPHAHQVMAGESTSYIFHVSNTEEKTQQIDLRVEATPQGWSPVVSGDTSIRLDPGRSSDVTVNVTAPKNARLGDKLTLEARAVSSTGRRESATASAEVTDVRNVYYWSIDSMNPEYLYLDGAGTGKGREGDWLMPNLHAFMKDGENYTDAQAYLPSATDMNHTNALAGTYTGTQGIYMVGGTYRGFTRHDEVISGPNSMDLMLSGRDGQPIQRVYEVAKQQTGGKALTGFWSNKNWLADLEGQRSVDIVGHSERWPLFFKPPYQYRAAGDPASDENPQDPLSGSFKVAFHSNNLKSVIIPTLLGQFDMIFGLKVLTIPLSIFFGKTPGMHSEDQYIYQSFTRSIIEEDPDVSYINIGDLDNTGHFTGSSWSLPEWENKGTKTTSDDTNKLNPFAKRDECLDIAREADLLFGKFVKLLKQRGVYDNSTIVFLSDHGMENMKDPKKGYELIDLREILRSNGYLRHEDYEESGGTEINIVWAKDQRKLALIERALQDFTVDDKELGKVHPLTVIDRTEMARGVDFGKVGVVRPGELYSQYWIDHPGGKNGEQWPDLFVFPLYNYQVLAHGDVLSSGINAVGINMGMNVPDVVKIGLPAAHGGLQTTSIPLIFKAPAGSGGFQPGSRNDGEVGIGDIAPTIYGIMGWAAPSCVDGKSLKGP